MEGRKFPPVIWFGLQIWIVILDGEKMMDLRYVVNLFDKLYFLDISGIYEMVMLFIIN